MLYTPPPYIKKQMLKFNKIIQQSILTVLQKTTYLTPHRFVLKGINKIVQLTLDTWVTNLNDLREGSI